MQKFKVGDLVVSLAGHDMGNFYVILKILDENYVQLVDGKNKKVTNPKTKKIKHILSLGKHETEFEQNLLAKDIDSDAYIKKILKNFEKF